MHNDVVWLYRLAFPDAIGLYGKRWQTETLFSCLKGRGFNLEDTQVTDRARIKRRLVVPVDCLLLGAQDWRLAASSKTFDILSTV